MSTAEELLATEEVQDKFNLLPLEDQLAFTWRAGWLKKAHAHQKAPQGEWWSIWLMLAGRGAGKTRTAAEQVGWWAWQMPETRWLVSGGLEHVPADFVANTAPNLVAHHDRIAEADIVKAYYDSRR